MWQNRLTVRDVAQLAVACMDSSLSSGFVTIRSGSSSDLGVLGFHILQHPIDDGQWDHEADVFGVRF